VSSARRPHRRFRTAPSVRRPLFSFRYPSPASLTPAGVAEPALRRKLSYPMRPIGSSSLLYRRANIVSPTTMTCPKGRALTATS
jgi:hypothetical protein